MFFTDNKCVWFQIQARQWKKALQEQPQFHFNQREWPQIELIKQHLYSSFMLSHSTLLLWKRSHLGFSVLLLVLPFFSFPRFPFFGGALNIFIIMCQCCVQKRACLAQIYFSKKSKSSDDSHSNAKLEKNKLIISLKYTSVA